MTERAAEYTPMPPGPDALNALVVRDGRIDRIKLQVQGDSGVVHLHNLIGNYFTTCFNVGKGITGFCDDEFLLKDPEEIAKNWNVVLEAGTLRQDRYPIGSVIVIVGHTRDGESRSLTEEEMDRFTIDPHQGMGIWVEKQIRLVPTLCYRKD